MDFNEWWARQPKDPTKPITPRMAWDAAIAEEREACKRDCIAVIEARHMTGQFGFNAIHDCLDRMSKRSNVD